MKTIPSHKLQSVLELKGFEESSTHHHMYWFYNSGKKTSIRTRVSHSSGDYDQYLLGQVAKQLKLSKTDLVAFIECPLSREDYTKKLIAEGHIR
ncbi:hypothetical protein HZB60_03545 [candidate division KSB1 bacterium]|nr:hypothetical protein [candidate division KSB1 bacterium]